MQFRPFGNTTTPVSVVGLGTWQLGGTEWGDVPEADALAVLHRAVDAGTNFFDTADIYGAGRSETLIGRFLRQTRAPVLVATKLGRRFDAPNGWPQNFTLEFVRRHTQESLQRLGIERIFLQQLHCIPFDVLQRGEIFDHLRTIQREGLIEHWGVSVETVAEGLFCLNQTGCAALQVIYNIFRQKLEDELLPQARAKGVAILARVPLASGVLSGQLRRGQTFAPTDHRHFNADGQKFNVGETFAGVPFDTALELVEKIKAIVPISAQAPLAALALRWVIDHPAVTTVIPGATKPHQAATNALAADLPPLSDEVHRQLRELYQNEIAPVVRGRY